MGDKEVQKIFSKEVLEKVQYVVSPIVIQELIFVSKRIGEKINLKEIDNFVNIVSPEIAKTSTDLKKIKEFRNFMIHTNDILLVQSAISSGCDYFLTYDIPLAEIGEIKSLKMISPEAFSNLLGVRR